MNSGKEMWLREMRALPPGQALDALAHTILRLEDRVRELECGSRDGSTPSVAVSRAALSPEEGGGQTSVQLTGVSWWGFGTIWIRGGRL